MNEAAELMGIWNAHKCTTLFYEAEVWIVALCAAATIAKEQADPITHERELPTKKIRHPDSGLTVVIRSLMPTQLGHWLQKGNRLSIAIRPYITKQLAFRILRIFCISSYVMRYALCMRRVVFFFA